ncbi:MAG TPA: response regulator [Chloroflexota bacterium]|nr:response regulator [Chloroflexota bacterium]
MAVLRERRPDAIVLDMVMPDVDGSVFRAAQLDRPEAADVPVLLLSATRAADLETVVRDVGAAAWLTKPG